MDRGESVILGQYTQNGHLTVILFSPTLCSFLCITYFPANTGGRDTEYSRRRRTDGGHSLRPQHGGGKHRSKGGEGHPYPGRGIEAKRRLSGVRRPGGKQFCPERCTPQNAAGDSCGPSGGTRGGCAGGTALRAAGSHYRGNGRYGDSTVFRVGV